MEKIIILWVDDEIDLLKPHILFLTDKGYEVITSNNGIDAIEILKTKKVDLVFLDENMPGISGIETLTRIKKFNPETPIIMITKSEEEHIMEDAIGTQIADYLIKPVNPNQILLSIKKSLDKKRLVSQKTSSNYQQEFRNIGMSLSDKLNFDEWCEVYKNIVYWELELEKSKDSGMYDILKSQKKEANNLFGKFIEKNYVEWLRGKNNSPQMSHTIFKNKVIPSIEKEASTFLLLIDNLRYDQWKIIQPIISEYYRVDDEMLYSAILPTVTHYARNSFFAGLMPSEIQKIYPHLWVGEDDEEGRNLHEEELMREQFKRLGKSYTMSYTKVTNLAAGKKMVESLPHLIKNKFNVIVYNFVDMLSHARTEMEVIKELAQDEAAYRSLTLSWFEHSQLFEAIKYFAAKKCKLIITTDHGTVCVNEPTKVIGDKNVNTNLRYKQGKALDYNAKDVFEVKNPADIFLPKVNVSTTYIFAKEDKFFAYPNNYNYYVSYYRNTFQHGGISLEEVLIPFVILSPK